VRFASGHDPHVLPPDLPVPEDDGACDHLLGELVPAVSLTATTGAPVALQGLAATRAVLFVYPRTGRPGVAPLVGWDAVPGARGCTPQSCGFRDRSAELRDLGADIAGLSAQPAEEQAEFAAREKLSFPILSDEELRLADALGLPTFDIAGMRLYRRVTLVLEAGRIRKVFYPVFPPDRNAEEVAAWLREQEEDA